ncbi:xanthine dehydrogenase family protein molybdopterin-binding subunit [Extibacter muris]|uniref:xanthine dehydrogenase family protein molybdopterin-binding subunit n=1 Tax=Extibacter muris TaxID=1796622 RepID=UPI001D074BE9|nr:molybdopterin cofactor-binding domain-containing protein [Extibacter muris]MCB6202269.1 molybdopterin-dependent oxidoreductase [Extibacter muris]MCQ4665137.1 molybdopterin-dependent oxidoreductase [Extibacter muris]MCQ4694501.1 molybdopterin-dependent oxidoreductase [Extibacter muris]
MACEIPKNGMIGASVPVRDASLKVTGQIRYVGDMKLPGMLYAKMLYSPHPHARIKSIDTSKAEALDGVEAVVCYKDSPQNRYNGNGEDKDINKSELVFDQVVRYVGDKVAAVAADSEATARKAIQLIEVEYEELPFYLDPEEAVQEGAYAIHEGGNVIMNSDSNGGDVDAALKTAYRTYTRRYEMPAVNHCAIETHVSIAEYDAAGKLTVWTPTQDAFGQRINLQRIFGLPMSKIRIISPVMGGGFGGKIDLVTEPVTALLAIKTGKPVKMVFGRAEEFFAARTRHGAKVDLTMGVTEDGSIIAADESMILNAGAHTSATMSVCWAAGGKFYKLLNTRNLRFKGLPVYTNTAVSSAMRGFGSPQQFFPVSSMMNEIANDLKMDASDVFLKNLAEPFEEACCDGESFGNFRLKDCVKKGKEMIGWDQARQEMEESVRTNSVIRIGVGMGCGSHGTSMFPFMPDVTGITMKMNEDGTIVFTTGTSDMGNGSVTTQCMMISEVLGIPLDSIAYIKTDTDAAMADLGAYASRGTYTSGHAAVKTAEIMKDKIADIAAVLLKTEKENLDFHDNCVWRIAKGTDGETEDCITMNAIAEYARETNQEDLSCSYMFHSEAGPMSSGAHFAKVQVHTQTGEIKILEYVAVHDVGRVVNPLGITGQLEGGISMGLGYALCEEMKLDDRGKCLTKSFKSYHILNAQEMPNLKVAFLDSEEETGPYGAKSVGECAVVPVAPTIANAVSNAVGTQFYKLPIRPENVLEALKDRKSRSNA